MLFRHALVASVVLALPVAGPAAAAMREPVSISVPTHDLDLTSPRDISTLKTRANAAIANACESEVTSLHGDAESLRCNTELRRDMSAKLEQRLNPGTPAVRVLGADSTSSN